MAKKIPVKKKAKKKLSSAQHERYLKKVLAEYDEETDARYAWAMKFLKKQDEGTREAVDRLVTQMKAMAGRPSATVQTPDGRVTVNIEEMIQERNFIYIAVRLLIAAANLDIQVAKWKFPNRCGVPLCGRKVS